MYKYKLAGSLKRITKTILQFLLNLLIWDLEHLYKWPYVKTPNKKIYRPTPQYLYGRLPNAELHTIICNKNKIGKNSILTNTSRAKIQIDDYYDKKNLFIIFFPGTLSQTPKKLYNVLFKLTEYIQVFNKYDIEVLIIVQSFSLEIRWMLNLYLKENKILQPFFPIIIDPWGLVHNFYNTLDQTKPISRTNTYTIYLTDKKLRIQHIESFNNKFNINLNRILKIINRLYNISDKQKVND